MTNTTNNDIFGFQSDEFTGTVSNIPYGQFLNKSSKLYGLAISKAIAEAIGFVPDETWGVQEIEYSDGKEDLVYYNKSPRMLVINESDLLMSNEKTTQRYNKELRDADPNFKPFTYLVAWFVGTDNQPLSALPVRYRLRGKQGGSLSSAFKTYKNDPKSFTAQVKKVYAALSGDATAKNSAFFSHFVFEPTFESQIVTDFSGTKSSRSCVTTGCKVVTAETIKSILIPNGDPLRDRIKEQIAATADWVSAKSPESKKPESLPEVMTVAESYLLPVSDSGGEPVKAEQIDLDSIPF